MKRLILKIPVFILFKNCYPVQNVDYWDKIITLLFVFIGVKWDPLLLREVHKLRMVKTMYTGKCFDLRRMNK
jgi:hypothetical protein